MPCTPLFLGSWACPARAAPPRAGSGRMAPAPGAQRLGASHGVGRAPKVGGAQGTRCSSAAAQKRVFKPAQAMFGGLFGGGKAKEPAEEVPVLDESELPFPADVLDGTFLSGKGLAEAYDASRDGWSAIDFHAKCDLKGPCVLVGETSKGVKFGGFNPNGWASTDDYRDNPNAFLFRWMSGRDADSEPVKLPVLGGGQAATFDYSLAGPQWGADGLVIGGALAPSYGGMAGPDSESTEAAGDLRTAKSRLGLSYEALPDGGKTLLGSKEAQIKEIRVFYAPEIAALY